MTALTQADLARVRAELLDDPLGRGYTGLSNPEIWELNRNADRPGVIASKDIRRYVHLVNKMGAILSSTSAEARAFIDALDVFEDFDVAVPAYAAAIADQLDKLIGAGLLDAADKAAIFSLTGASRTRWAELSVAGEVQPADIDEALT